MCVKYSQYKKFKKPVKVTGTIEKVHPETREAEYSYTDNAGELRTDKFLFVGKNKQDFQRGSKIEIFFDAECPENSIPECLVNAKKRFALKVIIGLVICAVVALTLFAVLDHFGIVDWLPRFHDPRHPSFNALFL